MIVITGPVGGGKSTVSRLLAQVLRKAGHRTAVVDLDVVYMMARQAEGFGEPETWTISRNTTAQLANTFFSSGMDTVIVEGGFLSALELQELQVHLTSNARVWFFTLLVSAANALHRAQHDPDPARNASRLAHVQAELYAEFEAALPYLHQSSQVIDANSHSPQALADMLGALVLEAG